MSIRTVAGTLLFVAVLLGVAGATYGIVRIVSDNQPKILPTVSGPLDPWTSVTRTKPILGGEVFGGDGNQYMFDVTGYRYGFVAVGEDCCGALDEVVGVVWSSPDGISWARIEPRDVFAAAEVDHVATSGSRIVAFGTSHAEPQSAEPETLVWLSDDGLSWRRSDVAGSSLTSSFRPAGVAGGPSGFLAWGLSPSGIQHVAVSADGETWTDVGFADAFPGTVVGGIAPWREGWAAVGSEAVEQGPDLGAEVGRAAAWYSADGVQWSPASADGLALERPLAGAYGLLAIGAGSECRACVGPPMLWHSDDGRSWQSIGLDLNGVNRSYAADGVHIVRLTMDPDEPARGKAALAASLDGASWNSLATGLAGGQLLRPAVGPKGILLIEPVYKDSATDQVDASMWYLPAK
jgi:hypothetical protein